MRRRAKPTVIAVIATALAIAGCGGGGGGGLSNPEYAQKLKSILVPLGQSLKKLGAQATSATSKQQITAALGSADNAVQKASDGIQGLDPPSAATDSNADIVTALDTYEKSIADTEETIRSGTKQEIRSQVTTFQADSRKFASTLKQIKGQLKSEGIKLAAGG
jgi:hypothetical protein